MKARIPKKYNEENNEKIKPTVISANQNFAELLSKIEEDYYKLLEIHGEENLLAIANTMLKSKYLNEFGINKHSIKHARQKILSLLESSVISISGRQYEDKIKSSDTLELDVLYSMSKPKYIESVTKSKFSDEIKNTVKNAVQKLVYRKAEALGISKEEFDLFLEDPQNHKPSIHKKDEENLDTISETEPASKTEPKAEIASNEISESTSEPETSTESDSKLDYSSLLFERIPFFEQVKGYTRNFTNFLVTEDVQMSGPHLKKFSNYEDYLKFHEFQKRLKEYSVETQKSELEIINQILDKKSKEFAIIDKDFIKILSARKQVILEKMQSAPEL